MPILPIIHGAPSLEFQLTVALTRVRKEAAQALRALKDQRAIPALIEAYQDTQYESFIDALWTLGEFQDDRVQALLLDALKHKDWRARSISAKLLDQRGWEPGNREQRIRRLIALEQWQDAVATGPCARAGKERPTLFLGSFDVGIPIVLDVLGRAQPEPKILACPWIEFSKVNDRLQAVLEMRVASWPKAKWRLRLEIRDGKGKVLGHDEQTFANSGTIEKVALAERNVVRFEVGSLSSAASAAELTLDIKAQREDG